ncbi:hypothetical protein EAH79_05020 [Sphingomonas koreensis]|nr:hypothetical protein EAH79_05020 [Sphingomonas koreensis]
MGQPKAAASLSSGLLARKGQARPAMRPQGLAGFGNFAEAMDDLGWNDMHGDQNAATVVAETPILAPVPTVLREREALKEEIEAPKAVPAAVTAPVEPAMTPAALNRVGRTVRATQSKGKTAFTLRLDADRHLRLRLATAVSGRSAQMLVTEALDAFLETLPEVEELANALPARGRKNQGD